jgi:short-subunit dehydrogenase
MHIVITGASSGIGKALALELGKIAGARLTLVARRKSLLEALARGVDAPSAIIERDLSSGDAGVDFIAEAEAVHGPVDVLINNAGVQVVGATSSIDVDAGETSLKTNLMAPLRLIARVLPQMIARKSGQIVNVASMAALAPTPGMTYYNAGKAGLAAASEALRGELRGSGVNVLTVYPGIIADTPMAGAAIAKYESNRALRLQPTASAAELAAAIRRAMEKKRSRLVFPRVYAVTRWFPTIVRIIVDRFSPRLIANNGMTARRGSA